MIIFQTKAYREAFHTALCVIGLSLMMVGFYIFIDRFNLSIILGSVVGGAASILNYVLNVMTAHAAKNNQLNAASIILISKIFRTFLMGLIVYLILLFPILHVVTGITAMFFANIRHWAIKILKVE